MLLDARVVEPFLKWPGGKRLLRNRIIAKLPECFGRYHEPFAGGAAVYLAIAPKRGFLSDVNPRLIECYSQVRDNPGQVIDSLRRLVNSSVEYYRIRDTYRPQKPATRAARLIYLQSLSFNGIYRENASGAYNVPYGKRTYVKPCDENAILCASEALVGATIEALDFRAALKRVLPGDVVYLDPPYTVAHNNNGFIKYNSTLFSWQDQLDLAEECERLAKCGCSIVITNANHDAVQKLYSKNFRSDAVERFSAMAASSARRVVTSELLLYSDLSGVEPVAASTSRSRSS